MGMEIEVKTNLLLLKMFYKKYLPKDLGFQSTGNTQSNYCFFLINTYRRIEQTRRKTTRRFTKQNIEIKENFSNCYTIQNRRKKEDGNN